MAGERFSRMELARQGRGPRVDRSRSAATSHLKRSAVLDILELARRGRAAAPARLRLGHTGGVVVGHRVPLNGTGARSRNLRSSRG